MGLPDEVLPCICGLLDTAPALAAGAAARAWRRAQLADDGLWRGRFVCAWERRQKPAFMRGWWRELLASGAAAPPCMALTAPFAAGSEESACGLPPGRHTAGSSLHAAENWHARYVRASMDLRRQTLANTEEVCDDFPLDCHGSRRVQGNIPPAFARRWVLVAGALSPDFLGDEAQFNADGSVGARCCLLLLEPDPLATWSWRFSDGGDQVVLSPHLEGERSPDVTLWVARARDGGFVLRGPRGVVLCSREKTEEEHIYRCYGILNLPSGFSSILNNVKEGRCPTPYSFPATLTSFERLAVHRLADHYGLIHGSRGRGVDRHIIVWVAIDAVEAPEVPPEASGREAGPRRRGPELLAGRAERAASPREGTHTEPTDGQ